jgi:hypothetical protein
VKGVLIKGSKKERCNANKLKYLTFNQTQNSPLYAIFKDDSFYTSNKSVKTQVITTSVISKAVAFYHESIRNSVSTDIPKPITQFSSLYQRHGRHQNNNNQQSISPYDEEHSCMFLFRPKENSRRERRANAIASTGVGLDRTRACTLESFGRP